MRSCRNSSDWSFAANKGETMSNRDMWEGSRYICLGRQSNDDEGDDSVLAQLKYLRSECDGDGMIYVDKILLEGVTGSLPARRGHYSRYRKCRLSFSYLTGSMRRAALIRARPTSE